MWEARCYASHFLFLLVRPYKNVKVREIWYPKKRAMNYCML